MEWDPSAKAIDITADVGASECLAVVEGRAVIRLMMGAWDTVGAQAVALTLMIHVATEGSLAEATIMETALEVPMDLMGQGELDLDAMEISTRVAVDLEDRKMALDSTGIQPSIGIRDSTAPRKVGWTEQVAALRDEIQAVSPHGQAANSLGPQVDSAAQIVKTVTVNNS